MTINKSKGVEAQMLIRKPVATVFEAFVNPEITRNFWFTKSSGRLEPGRSVTWEWEMYGFSTDALVNEISENEKISITWNSPLTTVDFEFTPYENNTTYVVIRNYGFDKEGDELLNAIKDSTGGFTTVLDGLKAFLEHGIQLNLIADKFPDQIVR